ncbi:hypothetical protein ABZ934_18875 [Streptomyces sp. NPDC046557]|uniref:hypothetical protein n=1 Tax=Streptomyces sp. NPDC046557 TaxID=3155372 RepID=UPI0033E1D23D
MRTLHALATAGAGAALLAAATATAPAPPPTPHPLLTDAAVDKAVARLDATDLLEDLGYDQTYVLDHLRLETRGENAVGRTGAVFADGTLRIEYLDTTHLGTFTRQ